MITISVQVLLGEKITKPKPRYIPGFQQTLSVIHVLLYSLRLAFESTYRLGEGTYLHMTLRIAHDLTKSTILLQLWQVKKTFISQFKVFRPDRGKKL